MSWVAVFAMGVLLGLLGGGGGILTVPILVGFFGLPATQATGASLFVVGVASVLGGAQGAIKKEVDFRAAALIAIPSSIGAFAARKLLVPSLPPEILGLTKDNFLLLLFAVLMAVVGWRMIRTSESKTQRDAPALLTAAMGLAIGLVAGTLGAGGGFLIVPALTLLLGVDIKRAIPTSLTVIAIQSLIGFLGELGKPISWNVLMPVLGVAIVGMLVGMPLRDHAPKHHLRTGFAALIFVVAAWMVFKVSTS